MQGRGRFVANDKIFEGEVLNSQKHGYAVESIPNVFKYYAQFKNDILNKIEFMYPIEIDEELTIFNG